MRDLHHYFIPSKGVLKGTQIDLQFDVSFFKKLDLPVALPSYDASLHEGKVPDLCINVLSRSTWKSDISEHVESCRDLSIPVYVVFSPYIIPSRRYSPPFLRVYILQEDGTYREEDLRAITLEEGGSVEENNVIDISDTLPFRLGLMRLKKQYLGGTPLFRLILLDPSETRILPTEKEKEINGVKIILDEKEKIIEEKNKIIADLKKQLDDKK